MNKVKTLWVACALILSLTACSGGAVESAKALPTDRPTNESSTNSPTAAAATPAPGLNATPIAVEYDSEDLEPGVSGSDVSYIKLEGDSISLDGSGATIDGTTVVVDSAGTYDISGTLRDGQIVVDTQDKETVVLVLDGIDLTCLTSAPIYVVNAEKTVITLADGTENRVADGEAYVLAEPESGEPNAAIFSHDDLTINGSGSLTVEANYNHGIASKDDLKIVGGRVAVDAVNDGLKGRDSIAVREAAITVNAGGDGMQSNNDEDAEKGWIAIEDATLDITAALDGIQAETRLTVSGGDLTISTGGGSGNSSNQAGWGDWGRPGASNNDNTGDSAKGLKAGVEVVILGGTIHVDASDDAIHSDDRLVIGGGEMVLASGDDGVHADSNLEIDGGNLTITQSYEGIESATITINDGTIHVVSSDDGINAAGGRDGSSVDGRPGQNRFEFGGDYHLYLNGGYIVVDAMGDGLDINGPIDMTGGTVIVNGPTANNNGALDYGGAFNISGGLVVAVGSSGMAQAPSISSTQYSVIYYFQSPQAAGTLFHVETDKGQELLTVAPTKAYQSVVLSSPELQNGATYVIYTGGRSTGTLTDSMYAGGTYTPGTQVASLKISDITTAAGAAGGFGGGPGGGGMRPPGGGGRRP